MNFAISTTNNSKYIRVKFPYSNSLYVHERDKEETGRRLISIVYTGVDGDQSVMGVAIMSFEQAKQIARFVDYAERSDARDASENNHKEHVFTNRFQDGCEICEEEWNK